MKLECLLAYFAGAIDADGFISIQRSTRRVGKQYTHQPTYYAARMGFTGTATPRVQELLKGTFGGSVYKHVPANPSHKPWHSWIVDGKKAEQALRAIAPYLISKGEQAQIALSLIVLKEQHWQEIKHTQKPPYRITPTMESEQRKLWESITALNAPRNRRVYLPEHLES